MQRGNRKDDLFTILTAGMGLVMLVAASVLEADGRGRAMLVLGGMGGMVAAGRHWIAALVAWLRRR
jgi:hypothetical protein